MTNYSGVTWRVNYGEISERNQFRVGRVGMESYDAYFEVGSLVDLISVLNTVNGLGLGQVARGTAVQARKVSDGLFTSIRIEPRIDTGDPVRIMVLPLADLPDFLYALGLFQTDLPSFPIADDWDFSKLLPVVVLDKNGKLQVPDSSVGIPKVSGLQAALDGIPNLIPTGKPVTPAQAERVITTFQAGHGWTVTGAASVDLNCIDTPAMGSQFLRVTTQPTGGAIADSGVLAQAVDARARAFRITFRVPAFLDLSIAYLFAGDNTMANYYQFRFMNGESDGGFQYTRGGEWATITLNWGDATIGGTPDRSKITRFRLSSVGNNKNLQIDFNELSIVPEQSIFPKGVVTFCFDDNHSSVQTYGVPILSKYQVPATIFTIAELVGTPDFMTLDQLKDAERRLGWEVAAHAYTNATHVAGYTNLTPADALRDMQQIRDWLTANGFKGSQHLAFPHGYYDKDVLQIAKNVFRTARGTVRRTHFETLPMGDPYRVRCIEVFNTDTVAFVKGEIDKAVANRSWLTLLFHILSTPASAQTSWTPADFEDVVAYATASGAALRTYGAAVDQGTQALTPTKTNTRVSASSSSSYTVPDSTVKSNVPGAAVSFDSNGTSAVHTVRVGADITSLGGTAILIVTVLIDGVSTLVGALNVEDAARRRDRRNYTWESVTGLGPGTHNAQVQVALVAAGATGGFTINSLATISVESPPPA